MTFFRRIVLLILPIAPLIFSPVLAASDIVPPGYALSNEAKERLMKLENEEQKIALALAKEKITRKRRNVLLQKREKIATERWELLGKPPLFERGGLILYSAPRSGGM